MKKIFSITFCWMLFSNKFFCQCSADCTTGCNITITANPDATGYSPTNGQKVCIQAGAVYTGTLTLPAAGNTVTLTNCGTMSGTITWSGGTLVVNNSGSWTTTMGGAGRPFTYTNCSDGTFTGTQIQSANGAVFDNYGSVTTDINYTTGNAASQFNNRSGGTLNLTTTMDYNRGTFTNYAGATFSTSTYHISLNGGNLTNNATSMTVCGIIMQNNVTLTNNAGCTINILGLASNGSASGLYLNGGPTVTVNNYGYIAMTGTNLSASNANTQIKISNPSNVLNNYGNINASSDYYTYNQTSGTFNNYGIMNIYTFLMDGTFGSSTMYNECLLNVRNNYTQSGTNATTVTGPTAGGEYGVVQVAGVTTLATPSVYGTAANQNLDMCDAGTPAGGWDTKTGTEGAGVTHCANNPTGTTGGYCNAALILPIQLIWFKADEEEQTVLTTWQTMTETNNDYFTIEKSIDGKIFIEAGRVKGAGNSTEPIIYKFVDDSPFCGISYYRLKQTDYDGKFEYSKLVSINRERAISQLNLIYFFPDQNNNTISYQLDYSDNRELKTELINMIGEVVKVQNIRIDEGHQTFIIDASSLIHGVYILKVSDGINTSLKKIVY